MGEAIARREFLGVPAITLGRAHRKRRNSSPKTRVVELHRAVDPFQVELPRKG